MKNLRKAVVCIFVASLLSGCANPPQYRDASQGTPRQQVDGDNEGAAVMGAVVGAFVGFALGRMSNRHSYRGYDPGPPRRGYYGHQGRSHHDPGPPPSCRDRRGYRCY